jgi:serine protease Do
VQSGKVQRAYLGVGIQPVSYELAAALGVAPRSGVAVTDVMPDSPADKTGLKTGDVIVKFNGLAVTTPQQLQLAVERSTIGTDVKVDIVRDGKSMLLNYEAAVSPSDFGVQASSPNKPNGANKLQSLGLELAPLDSDVAQHLGLKSDKGLLVTAVQTGSHAAESGIEPGMVILQVNRKQVSSVKEFEQAMGSENSALLLIRTEQGSRFIVIER